MKTPAELVTAFVAGREGEVFISAKQANWLESLLSKQGVRHSGRRLVWVPDTHYEYQRQFNGAGMLRLMKIWVAG